MVVPSLSEWVFEKKVELQCPATSADIECIARMRAMGHYLSSGRAWSYNSELMRAERWYHMAADKNDEESMFHLGWVYMRMAANFEKISTFPSFSEEEKEVDPDKQKAADDMKARAIEWYNKSAEKGFAPAMNNLATLYKGADSFRWSIASANAGNPMGSVSAMMAYREDDTAEWRDEAAERWRYWNPKNVNPRDLFEPTLERTIFLRSMPTSAKCSEIREAARDGKEIIIWKY